MRSSSRGQRHSRQKKRGKEKSSSCDPQQIFQVFLILLCVIVLYELVLPLLTAKGSSTLQGDPMEHYVGISDSALRCCDVKSGQSRALVTEVSECAHLCTQNDECMSFDYDAGMCYLKRVLSKTIPVGINGLCKREHAEECARWTHYDFSFKPVKQEQAPVAEDINSPSDTIHICSLVTTGDRSDTRYIEGWQLLTKSALLRTEHPLHFHLVVDDGAKRQMLEFLGKISKENYDIGIKEIPMGCATWTFYKSEELKSLTQQVMNKNKMKYKFPRWLPAIMRKLFFSGYVEADVCLLLDSDQIIMRDLIYLWKRQKELLTPTTFASVTGLRNIAEIRRYCDDKDMPNNCHPEYYLTSSVAFYNLKYMKAQNWNDMVMNEVTAMIKEYPQWESLLGDQDLLNRMVGVYPEHFTILPCEWNCFFYDWQEREHDHRKGQHPKTCPHAQCGIVHFNHWSERNREQFFAKYREGLLEVQPHYLSYCAADSDRGEITRGIQSITYDKGQRLEDFKEYRRLHPDGTTPKER